MRSKGFIIVVGTRMSVCEPARLNGIQVGIRKRKGLLRMINHEPYTNKYGTKFWIDHKGIQLLCFRYAFRRIAYYRPNGTLSENMESMSRQYSLAINDIYRNIEHQKHYTRAQVRVCHYASKVIDYQKWFAERVHKDQVATKKRLDDYLYEQFKSVITVAEIGVIIAAAAGVVGGPVTLTVAIVAGGYNVIYEYKVNKRRGMRLAGIGAANLVPVGSEIFRSVKGASNFKTAYGLVLSETVAVGGNEMLTSGDVKKATFKSLMSLLTGSTRAESDDAKEVLDALKKAPNPTEYIKGLAERSAEAYDKLAKTHNISSMGIGGILATDNALAFRRARQNVAGKGRKTGGRTKAPSKIPHTSTKSRRHKSALPTPDKRAQSLAQLPSIAQYPSAPGQLCRLLVMRDISDRPILPKPEVRIW